MRIAFSILMLMGLLPASMAAQALPDAPTPADAASWNNVNNLARGQEITVARSGLSIRCRFAGATNDDLFCESIYTDREIRFNRADVEKIRLDQSRRNFWTVIGGGAVGGGLFFGISSLKTHDSATAVSEGVDGAAIGAFLAFIPAETVRAFHLIPGKLIYHRAAH
jgi:hypothetical protein